MVQRSLLLETVRRGTHAERCTVVVCCLIRSCVVVSVQEGEGQQSLECDPANQIAPKDSPVPAEDNMQVSMNQGSAPP